MKLPELPSAAVGFDNDYYDGLTRYEAPVPRYCEYEYFTAEQMTAYGKQCAIEALEEAANLLEEKMRITAANEVRKLKDSL